MFQGEKVVENKTCKNCNSSFEITDKDLEFYEKISPIFANPGVEKETPGLKINHDWKKYLIPSPTLCPDCRQQRRQAFKNIYHLYKNEETGLISAISPDKWLNVISQKEWWEESDLWLTFWRRYDFNKSFFEQFHELQCVAPRWNLIQVWCENCERSINIANSKNCYLVKSGWDAEDCLYGERVFNSKNIVDWYRVKFSDNCYEVYYADNCFNVHFSKDTKNSRDSLYLSDCENVSNCIWCVWLRNKEYHILNKKVSKDQFLKYKSYILSSKKNRDNFLELFYELKKTIPVKCIIIDESENCYWNEIFNSKNVFYWFSVRDLENAKYVYDWANSKDVMDVNGDDNGILGYENCSVFTPYNSAFCFNVATVSDSYYCETSVNLKNCFWCVGLHDKSYCILNKQYSKEDYERLVPDIIEQMIKVWEWWEFFPASLSPYWYNESEAQEYFHLKKDEALKQNFNWSTYEAPFPKVEKTINANKLPEQIEKIPDDILNRAIKCEVTNRPFKIIKQELEFYRKHNLPIPRRHPDQRHADIMAMRNPRKIFDRKCDKCEKDIKTTYDPDRSEIVYCEECYNKEIY